MEPENIVETADQTLPPSNMARRRPGSAPPLSIGGWYRVVRGIIRFLIWIFARLKVTGLEHVPDKGPYLLVTNHLHWLDAPVLLVAFPHRAYVFAASKRQNHWFFGPLFRSLDAIWVRRGEVDRQALRQALAVLENGGVLGLAPEGTRSPTGALEKGRSGAAYMAYRTGVPLVPAVTWGQEKVFPAFRRLHRETIHVRFGPQFWPPLPEGEPSTAIQPKRQSEPRSTSRASAAQVRDLTEEIMGRLAIMLPPEYRGVYAHVEAEHPELGDA